jgi:hypothetical protein
MHSKKNEETKKTTKLGQAGTDGGLLAETRVDAGKRDPADTRRDGLSGSPRQTIESR